MTQKQLVVFEMSGTDIVVKFRANWADRRRRKSKLKTLRALKRSLQSAMTIVGLAVSELEKQERCAS